MNLFNNLSKWIQMKFQFNSNDNEHEIIYKILVVGEHEVGKSSFCSRFSLGEFNLEVKPTKKSECYEKTLHFFEEKLKVYLIDVDSDIMKTEHSHFYTDIKGAIVLYDVTKYKSFEKIDNWVIDMQQNIGNKLPILIAGNKNDLSFLKCVHEIELSQKAINLNCDYIETSCVESDSVDYAIKFLIGKIYYLDLPENKKNYLKNYLN